MNPTIVELCAATAAGLLAATPWLRYARRVTKETVLAINPPDASEPEPVNELDAWDGEAEGPLSAWLKELSPVRSEDDAPEDTAKHRREVPAQ